MAVAADEAAETLTVKATVNGAGDLVLSDAAIVTVVGSKPGEDEKPEIWTITIPVEKTIVKKDNADNPPLAIGIEFELLSSYGGAINPSMYSIGRLLTHGGVESIAEDVAITGTSWDAYDILADGFVIYEKPCDGEGWGYSKARYYVYPNDGSVEVHPAVSL